MTYSTLLQRQGYIQRYTVAALYIYRSGTNLGGFFKISATEVLTEVVVVGCAVRIRFRPRLGGNVRVSHFATNRKKI
jgi:hypothetical protein